ncbi:hypothetical protein [Cellulomonas septica]|uniref:Chitin-binding type-3 domain-containing protein n=1 Tax=Cellulomonas septica TaxID=285080 RepID=A0ABX1JWC4_9CELL|nr:hypothetical protein [Cellulomonas septica]NKY38621.1 hypothetical protein [Cellulomonas septica]
MDRLMMEFTAPTTNVCKQTVEFKYLPRLSPGWKYKTLYKAGCVYAYNQQIWDPSPNIWLQHSSDVCGRVKNSATNQEWTGWLCHTIIA